MPDPTRAGQRAGFDLCFRHSGSGELETGCGIPPDSIEHPRQPICSIRIFCRYIITVKLKSSTAMYTFAHGCSCRIRRRWSASEKLQAPTADSPHRIQSRTSAAQACIANREVATTIHPPQPHTKRRITTSLRLPPRPIRNPLELAVMSAAAVRISLCLPAAAITLGMEQQV